LPVLFDEVGECNNASSEFLVLLKKPVELRVFILDTLQRVLGDGAVRVLENDYHAGECFVEAIHALYHCVRVHWFFPW
jgi:hypothetical protein